VPTLKDITNRSYREQYLNKAHFEITEIDKNIGLKLDVTTLTENRDNYLCLYFAVTTRNAYRWTSTNKFKA
jgi:hypothetical protein